MGKRIGRAVSTLVLVGCAAGAGWVVHDLATDGPSRPSTPPTVHETPAPQPVSTRFVKA